MSFVEIKSRIIGLEKPLLEKVYDVGNCDNVLVTLLHSHVNPTGLALWIFCLIHVIVTET